MILCIAGSNAYPLRKDTQVPPGVYRARRAHKVLHVTGESSYYSAAYDAALEIFQNAFDRFTDPDDKAMILSFLVMEKILGRFHPVDLDMAEKLNEIIGTLGSSNAAMYENYKRTIEQKRREIRMSSLYSDPSYTPSSSSGESGANLGKKVKGFLGNLFR